MEGILKICLIMSLLYQAADGLMCYQCSDTSDDGSCQSWIRTMRFYRRKFEETGHVNPAYMRDCSNFTEPGVDVLCMIAVVKQGNSVPSYIRGCSDGERFLGSSYDSEFLGAVESNNKTTCRYNAQGYVGCVTLCKENFCNGPSGAGQLLVCKIAVVFSMLVALMFRY